MRRGHDQHQYHDYDSGGTDINHDNNPWPDLFNYVAKYFHDEHVADLRAAHNLFKRMQGHEHRDDQESDSGTVPDDNEHDDQAGGDKHDCNNHSGPCCSESAYAAAHRQQHDTDA